MKFLWLFSIQTVLFLFNTIFPLISGHLSCYYEHSKFELPYKLTECPAGEDFVCITMGCGEEVVRTCIARRMANLFCRHLMTTCPEQDAAVCHHCQTDGCNGRISPSGRGEIGHDGHEIMPSTMVVEKLLLMEEEANEKQKQKQMMMLEGQMNEHETDVNVFSSNSSSDGDLDKRDTENITITNNNADVNVMNSMLNSMDTNTKKLKNKNSKIDKKKKKDSLGFTPALTINKVQKQRQKSSPPPQPQIVVQHVFVNNQTDYFHDAFIQFSFAFHVMLVPALIVLSFYALMPSAQWLTAPIRQPNKYPNEFVFLDD